VIAINDAAAYFVGKSMGRTPLIGLSPKKTCEGYVGAIFLTLIFTIWFIDFVKLVPVYGLEDEFQIQFYAPAKPVPEQILTMYPFPLPFEFMGYEELSLNAYHITFWVGAVLASLLTPFGGFFASGMKRAYNIKDFSALLPGHGGIVDRFDCTLFMSVILYQILSEVLYKDLFDVSDTLAWVHATLSPEEKAALLADLLKESWLLETPN
jgi:phosphatidate cytidylyltransferase